MNSNKETQNRQETNLMQLELAQRLMDELKNGVATSNGDGASSGISDNLLTEQQPGSNNESLLLDKLQDMVPSMPRGRELSKLEIINYVIDYIKRLGEMVVDEPQPT